MNKTMVITIELICSIVITLFIFHSIDLEKQLNENSIAIASVSWLIASLMVIRFLDNLFYLQLCSHTIVIITIVIAGMQLIK